MATWSHFGPWVVNLFLRDLRDTFWLSGYKCYPLRFLSLLLAWNVKVTPERPTLSWNLEAWRQRPEGQGLWHREKIWAPEAGFEPLSCSQVADLECFCIRPINLYSWSPGLPGFLLRVAYCISSNGTNSYSINGPHIYTDLPFEMGYRFNGKTEHIWADNRNNAVSFSVRNWPS